MRPHGLYARQKGGVTSHGVLAQVTQAVSLQEPAQGQPVDLYPKLGLDESQQLGDRALLVLGDVPRHEAHLLSPQLRRCVTTPCLLQAFPELARSELTALAYRAVGRADHRAYDRGIQSQPRSATGGTPPSAAAR